MKKKRPPRHSGKERLFSANFMIDQETSRMLTELSMHRDLSRSQVVRNMIRLEFEFETSKGESK